MKEALTLGIIRFRHSRLSIDGTTQCTKAHFGWIHWEIFFDAMLSEPFSGHLSYRTIISPWIFLMQNKERDFLSIASNSNALTLFSIKSQAGSFFWVSEKNRENRALSYSKFYKLVVSDSLRKRSKGSILQLQKVKRQKALIQFSK